VPLAVREPSLATRGWLADRHGFLDLALVVNEPRAARRIRTRTLVRHPIEIRE
jgi:hypothetical protein